MSHQAYASKYKTLRVVLEGTDGKQDKQTMFQSPLQERQRERVKSHLVITSRHTSTCTVTKANLPHCL